MCTISTTSLISPFSLLAPPSLGHDFSRQQYPSFIHHLTHGAYSSLASALTAPTHSLPSGSCAERSVCTQRSTAESSCNMQTQEGCTSSALATGCAGSSQGSAFGLLASMGEVQDVAQARVGSSSFNIRIVPKACLSSHAGACLFDKLAHELVLNHTTHIVDSYYSFYFVPSSLQQVRLWSLPLLCRATVCRRLL